MVMHMLLNMAKAAIEIPTPKLPRLINRAITSETKSNGNGISKIAFMPENRPRRVSGTRSGINPCWAPWAIFADICINRMSEKNTQYPLIPSKLMDNKIKIKLITVRIVPSRMKGRLRPQRMWLWSERMPKAAWASRAAIKVHNRSIPKYEAFAVSPTNFCTRIGDNKPLVWAKVVSPKKKILIVKYSYQRNVYSIEFNHWF